MVSRPERPGPPCNVPVWDRSRDPLLADPDAGHSKRATIAAPDDMEFVAQHGGGEAADLPVPRAAVVGWILVSQEQEDVEHLMCQGSSTWPVPSAKIEEARVIRGPCWRDERVSPRQWP